MIVGVTGPTGAGKDTVAKFIAKEYGLKHVSGGDILRQMLRSINLEPKKSALLDFGTFLRKHYGTDIVLKLTVAQTGQDNIVASGFRSITEAKHILKLGGMIFYIDAPKELRYKRILLRHRSDEVADKKVLRKFDLEDMFSKDPKAGNLRQVKKIADVVIVNDGSVKQLQDQIRAAIQERLRTILLKS